MPPGTITYNYTALQFDGADWAKDRHNASNPDDPPIGLAAFADLVITQLFDGYVDQRADEQLRNADVRTKYLSLTDAERVQVNTLIDSLVGP